MNLKNAQGTFLTGIIYTLVGYYLPVNDIHNLYTNKESYNIYNDNNFWKDKYLIDNLPFPLDEIKSWKKEYKKAL